MDWSDDASVIEYLVGYGRMLAGGERKFDEAAMRELVSRDIKRARNIASAQNHALVAEGESPSASLASIAAPTLVLHGTADPMFPLEHGEALAEQIPGAKLLTLEAAGHGIDRADWGTIVRAVLEHTTASRSTPQAAKSV